MNGFSHLDDCGNAAIVDITDKEPSVRTAEAYGFIRASEAVLDQIVQISNKKGDILAAARIAGIMAAKHTWELIPLCHQIMLTNVGIRFEVIWEKSGIACTCTVTCNGKTGVEMEALVGVSTALLTIYDMCKSADHNMVMTDIQLLSKKGGRSGDFCFKGDLTE
jgi:cyclic pyranopterin phosphate synthase